MKEHVKVEVLPAGSLPGTPPSVADLERLAKVMDNLFAIPGVPLRFGLDSIIGLIPGLGDAASSAVSLYILHAASRRGVSRLTLARMAMNVALDSIVGAIPVAGDLFDVYWKANHRNVELLRRHALANPAEERRLRTSDWLFFGGLAALLIGLVIGSLTVAILLATWLASLLFGK